MCGLGCIPFAFNVHILRESDVWSSDGKCNAIFALFMWTVIGREIRVQFDSSPSPTQSGIRIRTGQNMTLFAQIEQARVDFNPV